MATSQSLILRTHVVATDTTASDQFKIVKLTNATTNPVGTVVVASSVTEPVYGILTDYGKAGFPLTVAIGGKCQVKAGGTVAPGDVVGTDTSGRAVKYAYGTDATKYVLGTVIVGGAVDELVEVELTIGSRLA